jgi:hypothetical protein
MNGRVYDPFLGRFLSADDSIQALGATESINPYSYAWNAPLNYVDPTGHSLLGIVGALVGIAIAIFAPEIASFLAGSAETFSATELAVIGGFAGGFIGTYISTGNLSASLTAGLIGGVTAGLFAEIGETAAEENWTVGGHVFGHAFVGCFSGIASSGNCGSGAVSAALSETATDFHLVPTGAVGVWGAFKGAAEMGLIGGVSSRLSGGSFDDGFSVSAAGYLFNGLHDWLGRMFVGRDAHITLLAHLEGRPPDAFMWQGDLYLGGGGRPDLLYGPQSGDTYYGWEIKPLGQDEVAAEQLKGYFDASDGTLTAGNNALVFRDEASIRLRGTLFTNTYYIYTPGQAGVAMYSTEEDDIAERVQVFFYKQRRNNQPWRNTNVPSAAGGLAGETAADGLGWTWELFE